MPHENNSHVVIKILKTESIGVHLRLYSNVFSEMPESVNEAELNILSFNNKLNLPVGAEHVAISHHSFNNWGVKFFQQSEGTEEELAAFYEWFDAKVTFTKKMFRKANNIYAESEKNCPLLLLKLTVKNLMPLI